MGVLDVLIHVEQMGVEDIFRDGNKIGYCVVGSDQKKIARLCRRVDRFLMPHKAMLLRFLRRGQMPAGAFDIII